MKRTFAVASAAVAATPAVDIHDTSAATENTPAGLQALVKLGANAEYFDVPLAKMTNYKLVFAVADTVSRQTTAATALESHTYARLPGVLVTKTEGGNAVLKLDALTSEESRANLANQKKRVLAFKEDKKTLETMHTEAERLLGVKGDDVRRRAPADAEWRGFGKGTYGVLFKDDSDPAVTDCWRLFVHVTGERTERDKTRLLAIRESLYLLLKNAYVGIRKTTANFAGGAVFGDDEWGSLLVDGATVQGASLSNKSPVLTQHKTLGLDTGTRSVFRKAPPLVREKGTLHVHRWPDMEFVPAPFALATPMFWRSP